VNYRHHFHAGNFADLLKHAGILALVAAKKARPGPLTVIDTHAGAGLYDLKGEMALKSGEAEAGIARLMADPGAPPVFDGLKAAVQRANPDGTLRFYPGSPLLTASALGSKDRLVACELREDDARTLKQNLKGVRPAIETVVGDGFATAASRGAGPGDQLVLIDPPFERADDYAQIQHCVAALLKRPSPDPVLVWTPLKDLETFDSLLRGLEDLDPPSVLVVEARLRPLDNPMRLNGCALLLINGPDSVEAALRSACDWVVSALGEPGGRARVWRL
jgi:23S rRNA (adenine2030-N6)-methyltransferase